MVLAPPDFIQLVMVVWLQAIELIHLMSLQAMLNLKKIFWCYFVLKTVSCMYMVQRGLALGVAPPDKLMFLRLCMRNHRGDRLWRE